MESIVNINSGTAFITISQYGVYSSSKRALLGFSLAARAELAEDRIVVGEIYPTVTDTNFGKNRMGNTIGGGPSANYADGDKPEFVAGLVLQAVEEGQGQYFAKVWNLRADQKPVRDDGSSAKSGGKCLLTPLHAPLPLQVGQRDGAPRGSTLSCSHGTKWSMSKVFSLKSFMMKS